MTAGMHPALLRLAAQWPTYAADDGERCTECDQRVYTELYAERAAFNHLLHAHGYRLNGLQYDNQNRVIGNAADAEGALAR